MVWYTTVSIPECKQFADMFEKQYPFSRPICCVQAPVRWSTASLASTRRETMPLT